MGPQVVSLVVNSLDEGGWKAADGSTKKANSTRNNEYYRNVMEHLNLGRYDVWYGPRGYGGGNRLSRFEKLRYIEE